MATTDTNMTMRVTAAPAAARATDSSLRGRMGRGAIVVAAHVAVIYAVAASLGIVRSPISAEPMQAVMITETQPEQKPLQPIKPELATPNLAVLVDERGRPAEVRVQQSGGFPRLDQAAVEGLRRWRFQAAIRDGAAAPAWTTVRARFRLDA